MNGGDRFEFDVKLGTRRRERRNKTPRPLLLLLVAYQVEGLLKEGRAKNQAELAKLLGVSRARVTQVMRFLLLAPDVQEALLHTEGERLTERQLRPLLAEPDWSRQRRLWRRLLPRSSSQRMR